MRSPYRAPLLFLLSITLQAPTLSWAVQIPEGYALYTGHQDEFTLALPADWLAFDQAKLLAGGGVDAPVGLGLVIFSPVDLAAVMGPFPAGQLPDRDALLATLGRIETGETPNFFVDRSRSEPGMSCAGLGQKGMKNIQKRVHDTDFGRGTKTLEPLRVDSAVVGGCQGIHLHGRVQTRSGEDVVIDVHAASDGRRVYLFSLRNSAAYYEANHAPYSTGLATLRLAAASQGQ